MEYLLTIKEITSHQAILQDQDNNLIYWPKDKLPAQIKPGEKLSFKINTGDEKTKNLAKEILGEILNN